MPLNYENTGDHDQPSVSHTCDTGPGNRKAALLQSQSGVRPQHYYMYEFQTHKKDIAFQIQASPPKVVAEGNLKKNQTKNR